MELLASLACLSIGGVAAHALLIASEARDSVRISRRRMKRHWSTPPCRSK
jgi:hypothetical protein